MAKSTKSMKATNKKNSSSTAKNATSAAKKSTSSGYSTNSLAKGALNTLQGALSGLGVNQLMDYVGPNSALGRQLRKDFITDEGYIRGRMDDATNAAYDANRAQAVQDALKAESTNYANTRNAITEMRKNLIGSGSSGANVGAANATALQALLGLGQTNAQTTTDSLRAINDVSRERAATLAQNAVDAINTANDATSKMYDPATSSYSADHTYALQGAAEGAGNIGSTIDTNASTERQTSATNQANIAMNERTAKATENAAKTEADATVKAAKAGANQKITYGGKYTVKSK